MPNYVLRLFRDRLEAKVTTPSFAARPRVVFAREGAMTVRSDGQAATLNPQSAWHGCGSCTLTAGANGGTALRWELCTPASAAGVGELVIESPVDLAEPGGYLMRCDRVDFPLGGIAYTHVHRGPGIRFLLSGEIRVQFNGKEHLVRPDEPWFEAGPDPVLALASETTLTSFARVMVLPRELLGKSSIRYVLPEDQDKPKRQSYQLFVDDPIELHSL